MRRIVRNRLIYGMTIFSLVVVVACCHLSSFLGLAVGGVRIARNKLGLHLGLGFSVSSGGWGERIASHTLRVTL